MQKITPFLWFDNQAEEAAKFYTSVFENSKVGRILRYDEASAKGAGRPVGSVLTIEFEIAGQKFTALNGGPEFKFNESISFVVNCETQNEVDYFWEKLTGRRRTGVAVRLAEGQIRRVVANHSNGFDRYVARQGREEVRTGHEGDDANAEDRHRNAKGSVRRRNEIQAAND